MQERLQHLCQRIDRFRDKLQRGANEERLRDLQKKLVSVFRDVMENRLQDGHLQCGEFCSLKISIFVCSPMEKSTANGKGPAKLIQVSARTDWIVNLAIVALGGLHFSDM